MLDGVEFMGGPLDGYRHHFEETPDELPVDVSVDIHPDLLRSLTGDGERPPGPPTSTAVYRLGWDGDWPHYRHVASLASGQVRQQQRT